MVTPPRSVYFLPWLDVSEEISLGPVTLWPYFRLADQKVNDSAVRNYLDRLFGCFLDHRQNPTTTITICSYEGVDFQILNQDQFTNLTWAVNSLAFASMAESIKGSVVFDNRSSAPPSANVFELRFQGFAPGSDDMQYRAGNMSHFGLRLGEFFFTQPWATGGTFFLPNRELLNGLGSCSTGRVQDDVRLRLIRSLEFFKLAHFEGQLEDPGDVIYYLPKIVTMGTAFEILLDFPSRGGKAEYFGQYIERHLTSPRSVRGTRRINNQDTDLCLAACWAVDFYRLRNKVVHGDEVLGDDLRYRVDDWITHLIVADLVFEECLKRILFEHRLIGGLAYRLAEEHGGSPVEWGCFLNFDDYHETLGWIEPFEEEVEPADQVDA